jgi:hypothetical protein
MQLSFFKLLLLLAIVVLPTAVGAVPLRGAPGPLIGAGLLPALAVGYGFYWFAKRRRHKPD